MTERLLTKSVLLLKEESGLKVTLLKRHVLDVLLKQLRYVSGEPSRMLFPDEKRTYILCEDLTRQRWI